ncbi:DNA-directed RNA polymerase II subunit RPB11-a [Nowakowskiella sp. JEL0407]|nr:DNA-directed RNA polymerase II subunit RPB11-a [Nowakowskiella sp. JEL0407]
MNAPDRFELFVLGDEKKGEVIPDTKLKNAATFRIKKEDHTLANVLRMQLLQNPKVLFAGYKVPHPLEHEFLLKVRTTDDTTPTAILSSEVDALIRDITGIRMQFVERISQQREQTGYTRYQEMELGSQTPFIYHDNDF